MLPATPFQSQLATNYAPSKEDITTIQSLINEIEPQLVSLDAEIEALRARRAIYASFVAEHRALLSPIRQMPPDILRNIFSYCLPYDAPERVMEVSEAPMLLTQICSHWRDLALKTPTLWATLFLKIPMPPRTVSSFAHAPPREISDLQIDIEAAGTAEELSASLVKAWCRKVESLASLTKLWLSRAESCPLTIFFRDVESSHQGGPPSPQANTDFTQEPAKALASLICARSSQWAQLDVNVTESSPMEAIFLSMDPGQLSQLQSICVHWSPRQSMFQFVGPGHFLHSPPEPVETLAFHSIKATRLRSLLLNGFPGIVKDIPAVWSNLTELSYIGTHRSLNSRLESFTSSVALALLRECPNLVRCSLHTVEPPFNSDGAPVHHSSTSSEATVRLPFLQRFVVTESKQGTPLTFLNSLDLPALTSTTLVVTPSGMNLDRIQPRLSLEPLLLSSSGHGHLLQHLELASLGFSMSVSELVEALKLAEGVKELTINLAHVDPPRGFGTLFHHHAQPLPNPGQAGTVDDVAPPYPSPPPPFFRDALLNGLAEGSSSGSGSEVCPRLEVLRLRLGEPSEVTTRALKNLVARRGVVGPDDAAKPGGGAVATLQQIWIRFKLESQPFVVEDGPGMRNGNRMPVFPKRWTEDELNAGFNGKKVIRVERRKAFSPYHHPGEWMKRMPFETRWDSDSGRYERCC
jgi:chorismate mutase